MAQTPQTAHLTRDDVLAMVQERDIRFIRLWFTDILGQLKAFSINVTELEDAFEGGMGFDGSSITGFNAIEESDMIAQPDPGTFIGLPWRPSEAGVARMFCDILTPERTPYEGDPRHVLKPALARAERRAVTSTSPRSTPDPFCGARRCWRSSSWASTPSTPITRSAPASTRST